MLKRLFADIEVSPNEGTFWQSGYKLKVDYNNITKERSVICICWKWEGSREVFGLTWAKPGDDKKMLKEFIKALNEADELVFHNGDRFDIPWIRTRALLWGLSMAPKYKTIDTLKIARGLFRFNSNRLDYISKYLGIGSKIKTSYDLWKDVSLKNDKAALAKMLKYCKCDVILLEKVYKRLKNHIPAKSHYGVYIGKDRGSCPECGSDNIVINKHRISAAGKETVSYQCNDCGKYHQKPYSNVKNSRSGKS